MATVVADARKRYGHITSVIHAAGILRDALIALRTPVAASAVVDVKARGAARAPAGPRRRPARSVRALLLGELDHRPPRPGRLHRGQRVPRRLCGEGEPRRWHPCRHGQLERVAGGRHGCRRGQGRARPGPAGRDSRPGRRDPAVRRRRHRRRDRHVLEWVQPQAPLVARGARRARRRGADPGHRLPRAGSRRGDQRPAAGAGRAAPTCSSSHRSSWERARCGH